MSKTHFYRRAAPEAILAVDLTALLPPCSGGDIFSDPVSPPRPQNAPEQEAAAERAEHTRAADWRSRSAADPPKAAEATNKRMDELHARGELNSSELDVLYVSIWPRVRSAAEDF